MANTKEKLKERFSFLIDFAILESDKNNPYVTEYVELAFNISKKINYRVPKTTHLKVCKFCYQVRTAENTKTRTITQKKNNKFNKYLKLHCLSCDNIKKIKI